MTAMDRIRGQIKNLKSERAGMDDMSMAHGCLLPIASHGKMNSSIEMTSCLHWWMTQKTIVIDVYGKALWNSYCDWMKTISASGLTFWHTLTLWKWLTRVTLSLPILTATLASWWQRKKGTERHPKTFDRFWEQWTGQQDRPWRTLKAPPCSPKSLPVQGRTVMDRIWGQVKRLK